MYGLPQAGKLAHDLLQERLTKHGYAPIPNTPGIWKHAMRPVTFTLIVDNFRVKYIRKENEENLKTRWKRTTQLGQTGKEHYNAEYPSTGTTKNVPCSFTCPTTPNEYSTTSNMPHQHDHNTHHTRGAPQCVVSRSNSRRHQTIHISSIGKK
jgi:hypothetical protein